jgi:hypothetical protein
MKVRHVDIGTLQVSLGFWNATGECTGRYTYCTYRMVYMIHDIYFEGFYLYIGDKLVRLSRNASKVDQAGNGIAELQPTGFQMTDSAICCAQVCQFLCWAYNYTLLTNWHERLSWER